MNKTRNILLVGRTGQGKSALANLLINKNNNFEEVFKESFSSVSETKNPQTETFEKDGIIYSVIDTPSFSDTDLTSQDKKSEEELFHKLAQIASNTKGVNQILFVTNGRFTDEEAKVIGGLRSMVFDKDMTNYLTIVRTRFADFEDSQKCQEDWENLIQEGSDKNRFGHQVVKKIGRQKFIHLDNPPVKGKGAQIAKDTKELVRSKLLVHLGECSALYEPQNLLELNKKIQEGTSSIEEQKREIQEKIKGVNDELERLKQGKIYNEVERNRRLIDYTSQLSNLSNSWDNLEKETRKTTRPIFDAQVIKWASESGVKIGGDAFPLIGKAVGGTVGLVLGTGNSLLNGIVDLFQGSSREPSVQTSQSSGNQPGDNLLLEQTFKLQQQLSISQVKLLELAKENGEKDAVNKKLEEELAKVREEIKILKGQVPQQQQNNQQTVQEKKDLEKLEKQVEVLKTGLAKNEKAVADLTKKNEELEKKEKDYQKQVADLTQQLANTNQTDQTKQGLQQQLDQAKKDLQTAQEELKTASGKAQELEKKIANLKNENGELKKDLANPNQTGQSEKVNELEKNIEKLSKLLTDANILGTNLNDQLSKQNQQVSNLQVKKKELEAQVSQLNDKNAKLNKTINGVEGTVAVIGQPPSSFPDN